MLSEAENPRAVIGDNQAPVEVILTPLQVATKEIDDLWGEAVLWLDGAAIENEDQALAVGTIMREMQAAEKRADASRAAEKKPWDDGAQAIQDAYAPLIGKTAKLKGKAPRAIEGCKGLIAAWTAKEDARKREVAAAARREAEEQERIAQEAMRASSVTNLAERERAEQLLDQAKAATKLADKAEKDRAVVRGAGRAISSRVTYQAVITDGKAALRHAAERWGDDLRAFLVDRAERDMRAGILTIPGFDAVENRSVA